MEKDTFEEALYILSQASSRMCYDDYVKIWGKSLGAHIWKQESTDLVKVWKSGLNKDQRDALVNFLLEHYPNDD